MAFAEECLSCYRFRPKHILSFSLLTILSLSICTVSLMTSLCFILSPPLSIYLSVYSEPSPFSLSSLPLPLFLYIFIRALCMYQYSPHTHTRVVIHYMGKNYDIFLTLISTVGYISHFFL